MDRSPWPRIRKKSNWSAHCWPCCVPGIGQSDHRGMGRVMDTPHLLWASQHSCWHSGAADLYTLTRSIYSHCPDPHRSPSSSVYAVISVHLWYLGSGNLLLDGSHYSNLLTWPPIYGSERTTSLLYIQRCLTGRMDRLTYDGAFTVTPPW